MQLGVRSQKRPLDEQAMPAGELRGVDGLLDAVSADSAWGVCIRVGTAVDVGASVAEQQFRSAGLGRDVARVLEVREAAAAAAGKE